VIEFFKRYYALGLVLALVAPLWLGAFSSDADFAFDAMHDALILSAVLLGCGWITQLLLLLRIAHVDLPALCLAAFLELRLDARRPVCLRRLDAANYFLASYFVRTRKLAEAAD
jgi:hypothetical protein